MQTVARNSWKTASLGGRGNDVPFEQAFASIAHSYLQDVAPMLLDYELGFQLLDRNQDDTQAVGIMGFKLGSQLLYAPVFYIDNELKGHELLYIKGEDRFVPLKENWIKYLMAKKPTRLGNSIERATQHEGVRKPNYNRLRFPPNKFASASMPDWALGFLPKYADAKIRATVPAGTNLRAFLKKAGRETLAALLKTAAALPSVAKGIESFHGLNMLQEVWQEIKQAEAAKADATSFFNAKPAYVAPRVTGSFFAENHAEKRAAVQVHTLHDTRHSFLPSTLTPEKREELWKVGVLIEDRRPEIDVSKLYRVQMRKPLRNPSESGIYDVLMRDGGDNATEKCAIVYNPHTCGGARPWVTIVRLSDKQWTNENPANVFITKEYPKEDWVSWVKGLDAVGTLSATQSIHLLVNEAGLGVSPFKVELSIGDANGSQTYEIDFRSTYCHSHGELGGDDITRPSTGRYSRMNDGKLRIDEQEGTKLRILQGMLVAPSDMKKCTLDSDDTPSYKSTRVDDPDFKRNLKLGDMSDVQIEYFQKTAALKVWSDGRDVELNNKRMTKMAGLIQLVTHYGLSADAARNALMEAEQDGTQHYRVKLADIYEDMVAGAPGAPPIPEVQYGQQDLQYGGAIPAIEPQTEELPASDIVPDAGNNQFYDMQVDPQEWNMAGDAAAAGQQDVFDAATVGSLLKAHRNDSMIDQHITGLMDGLNRAGTLLFLFYAHGDQFEQRYGKSEMPELEDSLRTTFENLGDLCLFLKQKTVEASGEDVFDISLDGISAE